MSIDILGSSWDQYMSVVQYSFTSTKTMRLVRTGSPGRPPQLSHSSWNMPTTYHSQTYIYIPVAVYRTYAPRNDLPRFVKQNKKYLHFFLHPRQCWSQPECTQGCINVSKCVSYYACTSWADGIKRFVGLWCMTENTFSADPILQSCALCSALSW